jgi:hypothetical protein
MRVVLVALVFALVTAGGAQAEPIFVVDTGPGGSSGGASLTQEQWLGAKITLDQPYTVTSIEGWMVYLYVLGSMPVTAVVYGDAGDVPDTADLLFEQDFALPASAYAPGWNGVDGLALDLEAGTYWIAFEVRQQVDFGSGAMPPTPLQELDDYAIWTLAGGWAGSDGANLGIRVAAVPEPGGVCLLVAGVGCLMALNRVRPRR